MRKTCRNLWRTLTSNVLEFMNHKVAAYAVTHKRCELHHKLQV